MVLVAGPFRDLAASLYLWPVALSLSKIHAAVEYKPSHWEPAVLSYAQVLKT